MVLSVTFRGGRTLQRSDAKVALSPATLTTVPAVSTRPSREQPEAPSPFDKWKLRQAAEGQKQLQQTLLK